MLKKEREEDMTGKVGARNLEDKLYGKNQQDAWPLHATTVITMQNWRGTFGGGRREGRYPARDRNLITMNTQGRKTGQRGGRNQPTRGGNGRNGVQWILLHMW